LDVRAFQNRVLNTRGIKNTNCENYKLLQYIEKLYCILMVLGIFLPLQTDIQTDIQNNLSTAGKLNKA